MSFEHRGTAEILFRLHRMHVADDHSACLSVTQLTSASLFKSG